LLVDTLLKTAEKLYLSTEPLNEELKEKLQTISSILTELLSN